MKSMGARSSDELHLLDLKMGLLDSSFSNGCQDDLPNMLTHWGQAMCIYSGRFNTLMPRRNRRHFADNIFKCIFLNENVRTSINISPKFVPKGPINNIPALVQIMAWCRPGNKPFSEPLMVKLSTHICITQPQWVNSARPNDAHQ